MEEYFAALRGGLERALRVAREARARGLDPEEDVEIEIVDDMAARIEKVLGIEGVAAIIREALREEADREAAALRAAERVLELGRTPRESIEAAIRVGLAVLTEGVLIAPIEGILGVEIRSQGGTHLAVLYAGPIRAAGGTAQAISVLIADMARRRFGIGRYVPTEEEVERYKEEVKLYHRHVHLQYFPTDEEIELIVRNVPVCLDGEGTLDVEVGGYRDLPRVSTNRVRGGMVLVLAEGLTQKAKKLLKHVKRLGIDGWDFLEALVNRSSGGEAPRERYLEDMVAGRPILSYGGKEGGFRIRLGRARNTGLAAVGVNPALMEVLGGFLAVGIQLKLEGPGKAGAVAPVSGIEGPLVLLDDGTVLRVDDVEEARRLRGRIKRVLDLGEILIALGEFRENNQPLYRLSLTHEWWEQLARRAGLEIEGVPGPEEAIRLSREHGLPVHPRYALFWESLSVEDLRSMLKAAEFGEGGVSFSEEVKQVLERLGLPHRPEGGRLVPLGHWSKYLALLLGGLDPSSIEGGSALEALRSATGLRIEPKASRRIGARVGRPEKAKPRTMRGSPNVLFPTGMTGASARSITKAAEGGERARPVLQLRRCPRCGNVTHRYRCEVCGTRTRPTGRAQQVEVDLAEELRRAKEALGINGSVNVKGVKALMSSEHFPEPMEKGVLRALHGVTVFKDGTARFDMTDLPLTHFRPSEVGLTVEKARELGYERDAWGRPLESPDQLLELKPQDLIISREAGEYLVRVAKFVDDLLERFYGLEPFYRAEKPEDLIGHLVIGMAPHTINGVLGRIIGFADVHAQYAHPVFHAAKRRNCDGDEDSVMLLLDALLNFSRHYLPRTRGGMMDTPLTITTRVHPREVDKEVLSMDVDWSLPVEVYEASLRGAKVDEVEDRVRHLGEAVSEDPWTSIGFTVETGDIGEGVRENAYSSLPTMAEKVRASLRIMAKINGVDVKDAVRRVIENHFIRDIMGNMRKFATQEFRCVRCNAKFRRPPLSGVCPRCGGQIVLTVYPGTVTKYLEIVKELVEEFGIGGYLGQRVEVLERSLGATVTKVKQKRLI